MDVKAIQSTQAAIDMHTANTYNKNNTISENEQKKQDEIFQKLSPSAQHAIIQKSIDAFNEKMKMMDSQLRIEFDKDTGIKVVKIVDEKTKEVIRQIPDEAMLKIAKYIDELTGLLFEKHI
ncbi:flagellar protein FlaG [Nitratiruptor sp. YY08-26]|uniref:flagellar protein FlaG n=1 Tax=unclassified Nitratiruptor TaxID=2624044 RepID=UPI00191650BF|nr:MULTISPECIES: flagellar protein FlaG [unclassified Nitratiruptor]BCD61881.1 flagellar protein FlaG [Nitratiruptor sp. YY08-13]BCD65816.1 flagellar protein FlaG [Nitratiruptor sp. YY08-26]